MKEILKKTYWLISVQFGIDPRRMLRSLRGIPRFIVSWYKFQNEYSGQLNILPCLHDWLEEGGATKDEYFWQDLHVAQQIRLDNPNRHVDIGSRIDGFVAHVASFREIEIFDIRPITQKIPSVIFRQADLSAPSEYFLEFHDYCDSLSCLHALEHFGLGRYGDPISPRGHVVGMRNMAKIMKPGGVLYLSVPIGMERVEFNAHRIFDPILLVQLAKQNALELKSFASIIPGQSIKESTCPEQDIPALGKMRYALGIFTFIKQ